MPPQVLVQIVQELYQTSQKLRSVLPQMKGKEKESVKRLSDAFDSTFRASLLRAVTANDIEALCCFLDLKLDPNVKYASPHNRSTKATPLFIASDLGHTEAVSLLLEHRADPNLPAEDKRTPLMAASSNNHTEVVELLLSRGAWIETSDEDGNTALRYACVRNHVQAVKLLLEAGANPNVSGRNDWSCLLIACCDNFPQIVSLLLKHGADPYHVVKNGKTCLMMASQSGYTEVVSILLNSERILTERLINRRADDDWTALALAYDHPNVVGRLLSHGADPDPKTKAGWTPLMLACQKKGYPETVELLLKEKVDVDYQSKYGISAYGLANWNNNKLILEYLEKAGAKPRSLALDVVKFFVTMKPLEAQIKKSGSSRGNDIITQLYH